IEVPVPKRQIAAHRATSRGGWHEDTDQGSAFSNRHAEGWAAAFAPPDPKGSRLGCRGGLRLSADWVRWQDRLRAEARSCNQDTGLQHCTSPTCDTYRSRTRSRPYSFQRWRAHKLVRVSGGTL